MVLFAVFRRTLADGEKAIRTQRAVKTYAVTRLSVYGERTLRETVKDINENYSVKDVNGNRFVNDSNGKHPPFYRLLLIHISARLGVCTKFG